MDRLQEILNTMDVPDMRKNDARWLIRNIRIHNNNHPDIDEATELLMKQIRK